MWSQANLDLIINARITPDDVLVLGDNSENLAADIKTIVGDHTVIALRSTSVDDVIPGTHLDSATSVHVVQGQPTQTETSFVGAFGYVVCAGPSTLLDASTLPPLLRLWRTYLKDTGRIVLRMYAAPGAGSSDWKAMESRYRKAGEKSNPSGGGCCLMETNGLFSEAEELGTDGTDVKWLRCSIEDTANRIQQAGQADSDLQASIIRQKADQLKRYSRRLLTEAQRDALVRGNSSRGAYYATFRRK